MMNKKYQNIKSFLTKVEYNFEKEAGGKEVTLETVESIVIKSISDTSISLSVERSLVFQGVSNTYLKVVFEAMIVLGEKVDNDKFQADIKADLEILNEVFADASLVISQITDKSPFGAIITPPMYNCETIEIKSKG